MIRSNERPIAAIAFADTEAAHAFLELAEQAPEGTVYLQGVKLAQGALTQLEVLATEQADDAALLGARDRLRTRLAALIATLSEVP